MILDPNVAYHRLQNALENLDVTRGGEESRVDEVLEAWRDLDEWITRGGFLPSVWTEAQRRALENTRNPVTWAGVAPPAQSTAPTGAYDDPAVQQAIHDHLHTNPWEV